MAAHLPFRIVPLPREVAEAARRTRRDAFGHVIAVVRDGQPHQCRSCLSLSDPGESVLLLAHRPFERSGPYAEVGPIFVHERDCETYPDVTVYPPSFPRSAVVLRVYDGQGRIVGGEAVGARRVEEVIGGLFEDPATAYLHARNLEYGCYMFRIDRG